jgi:hypothetical protein
MHGSVGAAAWTNWAIALQGHQLGSRGGDPLECVAQLRSIRSEQVADQRLLDVGERAVGLLLGPRATEEVVDLGEQHRVLHGQQCPPLQRLQGEHGADRAVVDRVERYSS